MKRILILLLTLIISLLSLGFISCGAEEGNDKSEVEPYVVAYVYPQSTDSGRNAVTGLFRRTMTLGGTDYIKVETPELEGWYVTYVSDNENMLTVDENGVCTILRAGTVYVTVTYTNGVDKVTDIVSWYNTHWNRQVDVFYRGEGMDPHLAADNWTFTLGQPKEINPTLYFSGHYYDDAIIDKVTFSEEGVLSYENGVLTPLAKGTVTMTIECDWRGYKYNSWTGNEGETGSANLRRVITVTVN